MFVEIRPSQLTAGFDLRVPTQINGSQERSPSNQQLNPLTTHNRPARPLLSTKHLNNLTTHNSAPHHLPNN